MIIKIKPLSVNKCWQGRRYKTPEYEQYEQDLMLLLKDISLTNFFKENKYFGLNLEFGFSNFGSDLDNPVKPTVDILSKFYGFNDSRILERTERKQKVKKGGEYIMFEFYDLDEYLIEYMTTPRSIDSAIKKEKKVLDLLKKTL